MKVSICVGSSCHLKGSYEVIEAFKEAIKSLGLEDKVELQASFCLGHCSSGVTVKAGDRFLSGVNDKNAREVFEKEIFSRLEL